MPDPGIEPGTLSSRAYDVETNGAVSMGYLVRLKLIPIPTYVVRSISHAVCAFQVEPRFPVDVPEPRELIVDEEILRKASFALNEVKVGI